MPTKTMKQPHDLAALTTQHPGGYPDIIAALKANGGKEIKWIKVDQIRDPNTPPSEGPKWIERRTEQTIFAGDLLPKIEKALAETEAVSGRVAAAICHVLAAYQLPTPGDPRWLTPAERWF